MNLSLVDRLVLLLSTGLGLGNAPVAPGTFGSAGGILLAGFAKWACPSTWGYALVVAAVSLVGVPICSRAAALMSAKDPQRVVIDEIAAVLLLFVAVEWNWKTAALGFVLFRLLDVTKPWPIRALERLPRGWGIMADDLAAGAIAAAALYGFASLST